MGLRVDIDSALAAAQDESDEIAAATLRLVQCAIRDRDRVVKGADGKNGCEDGYIADMIAQMIRQRQDSATGYEAAGQADMAQRELEEIAVLSSLLPRPMTPAQVTKIAQGVVEELQAEGLKDAGRCIAEAKRRAGAGADGSQLCTAIKQLLAASPDSA